MKNKPIDILIGAGVTYLFLGVVIVSLQALSGAKCQPIRLGGHYVYTVNANASGSGLVRVGQWLPVAWENLVTKDVSLADYVAPKECLWVPDGRSPAEVLEAIEDAKPR